MAGKKKKNSWRNRIICLVAEILAVIALLLVLSQNFGFGYQITVWVNQLIKPAVKELDITGINSSYAVLMPGRERQGCRRYKWRNTDVSGFYDKDYDNDCSNRESQ